MSNKKSQYIQYLVPRNYFRHLCIVGPGCTTGVQTVLRPVHSRSVLRMLRKGVISSLPQEKWTTHFFVAHAHKSALIEAFEIRYMCSTSILLLIQRVGSTIPTFSLLCKCHCTCVHKSRCTRIPYPTEPLLPFRCQLLAKSVVPTLFCTSSTTFWSFFMPPFLPRAFSCPKIFT